MTTQTYDGTDERNHPHGHAVAESGALDAVGMLVAAIMTLGPLVATAVFG